MGGDNGMFQWGYDNMHLYIIMHAHTHTHTQVIKFNNY